MPTTKKITTMSVRNKEPFKTKLNIKNVASVHELIQLAIKDREHRTRGASVSTSKASKIEKRQQETGVEAEGNTVEGRRKHM